MDAFLLSSTQDSIKSQLCHTRAAVNLDQLPGSLRAQAVMHAAL